MTRVREANQPKFPANWAELLFDLGRAVARQVRRGAEIADIAKPLRATADHCALALAFVRSSDVVKLRAMVEDWSLPQITQELAGGLVTTEFASIASTAALR